MHLRQKSRWIIHLVPNWQLFLMLPISPLHLCVDCGKACNIGKRLNFCHITFLPFSHIWFIPQLSNANLHIDIMWTLPKINRTSTPNSLVACSSHSFSTKRLNLAEASSTSLICHCSQRHSLTYWTKGQTHFESASLVLYLPLLPYLMCILFSPFIQMGSLIVIKKVSLILFFFTYILIKLTLNLNV